MVIKRILEADKLIKGAGLRQFVIIGKPEEVDKVSALLEEKLGAVIKDEQCPWCGVNLELWRQEAHEEHAKDGPCNWKEAQCLALITDLGENYDRGNGPTDTPDPRKTLNLIVRIALRKP